MNSELQAEQQVLCEKYGAKYFPSPQGMKVGIASNVKQGIRPVNGLRHPPVGDTTGWYIWAGEELSDQPDFFNPLHIEHLKQWCPDVQKYLGLPPGWRFLIDGDFVDVWYDESLLNTD